MARLLPTSASLTSAVKGVATATPLILTMVRCGYDFAQLLYQNYWLRAAEKTLDQYAQANLQQQQAIANTAIPKNNATIIDQKVDELSLALEKAHGPKCESAIFCGNTPAVMHILSDAGILTATYFAGGFAPSGLTYLVKAFLIVPAAFDGIATGLNIWSARSQNNYEYELEKHFRQTLTNCYEHEVPKQLVDAINLVKDQPDHTTKYMVADALETAATLSAAINMNIGGNLWKAAPAAIAGARQIASAHMDAGGKDTTVAVNTANDVAKANGQDHPILAALAVFDSATFVNQLDVLSTMRHAEHEGVKTVAIGVLKSMLNNCVSKLPGPSRTPEEFLTYWKCPEGTTDQLQAIVSGQCENPEL